MVGHFPAQPHCFAYGGFDIQMNRVIDLLDAAGVASVRVNPWEQNCRFSIGHFWGGDESHAVAQRFCRERGIATVYSVLLPNRPSPAALQLRLRARLRRALKGPLSFTFADAVTVINDDQAWIAQNVVGVPPSRVHVVPTIVDEAFFEGGPPPPWNPRGAILCVGTIGPRKNQLALLRAAAALPNDVILCGRFDDAEPAYRADVEAELARHPARFHCVSDIPSARLRELYFEGSVLACISHHETEPASVLEAMICQRPVIVSDRPYGQNSRFAGAVRCEPTRVNSIQAALKRAIGGVPPNYPNFNAAAHRGVEVVAAYRRVYESVQPRA